MKTDLLCQYLKCRAQIEGVNFELTPEFFEPHIYMGVREFFGIVVDKEGFPLYDLQTPKEHPTLLTSFLQLKKIKGDSEDINGEELTNVSLN